MSRRALAALVATAVVMVLACSVAQAATWPNATDPTTTAAGSEAITHSVCRAFGAKDSCEFITANADGFLVILPDRFLSKFRDGTQVDAMHVIKALLAQRNTLNLSAIPSATSISPAYAAKLATVGVTPAQFLTWLYANVPASERPPWVPGSSNGPVGAVQKSVAPRQPASNRPTVNVQRPTASSSPSQPYPKPASQSLVSPSTPAAGKDVAPAAASKRGRSSSTVVPASKATKMVTIAPAGTVTPRATACPPGYSELNAPNGGRCLPDSAVGLKPNPDPWWANAWVNDAAGMGGVVIVGFGVGVVLRRRRRRVETR